ncbi:MAG TPA: carbohydrate kinase family protein [Candidatus Paceibacterota bacterium]|nr:carbohydrate kinase family protein [Candidatus Paceibacterota bacterium]
MDMDFLAIGGTVIDTFIRLKDADVHCDLDNEHCTISMRFADKIPFEFAKVIPAVGNSANAAVSAARLGLKTALITGLGKDRSGEDCLAVFKREGVSTDYISVKEGEETMNNYVLWYGPDRTILVKYTDFGYELPNPFPKTRILYVSSIGEANLEIHDRLIDAIDPETWFVFQPATFQIKAGMERLARVYARTNIFIANKEEYQRILNTQEESEKKLMEMMRAHGPKIAFLTDGQNGAYALSDEGAWKIAVYPDHLDPYDRTGAGDAFASTASAALLLGNPLPEALRWGAANAASVVQKIGAQEGLLAQDVLKEALAKTPEYQAEPL